ncbi:MAG: amidohydrolase family protein, partial [Rectinema sp.]|nr:amidohydrolase family protein [Rectinema sp.]
ALQLSSNITNGVTTAVGLLGTDSLTRALEDLYAKTMAFNEEGITAFMLTGAYWHPSPTIMGSVSKDIVFCQPVIGVKLALSDTRGPHLDSGDLAALASEVQVAGLVAGKAGIVTIHTGVRTHALDLICDVVDRFELRPGIFVPTHLNRKNPKLLDQAFSLAKQGMHIDATCQSPGETVTGEKMSAAEFALLARDQGVFERVTFSSDAGGSMPIWNEELSRILGMGIGKPDSLLHELKTLVQAYRMPLEQALLPLTRTPARLYGLEGKKGELKEGSDADLLVLDSDSLSIREVIAHGTVMLRQGKLVRKGYFE